MRFWYYRGAIISVVLFIVHRVMGAGVPGGSVRVEGRFAWVVFCGNIKPMRKGNREGDMDQRQKVTNEELTPYERDWLIREEVRRTIVSTSHDLFNYWTFPKSNAIDVSARGPQAHLAIEKSMKFILNEAGVETEDQHSLKILLDELEKHQKGSAQFLETAFLEARKFYGINSGKKGLGIRNPFQVI